MKRSNTKAKKIILDIAIPVFWTGVWQCFSLLIKNELLLPSPVVVFNHLISAFSSGKFWFSILLTFLRIFAGLFLGVIFGVLLATLTSRFDIVKRLFSPILRIFRAVPVVSFIILALVWIKKDYLPILIVFVIVMPIIWQNVSNGIEQTPKELKEVCDVFGFSIAKKIKCLYFHSVLPFFESALISSVGLAWKSGVAAEVIAMPVLSIGYYLYTSKINLETADLFAWTAVVVVLSLILEKGAKFLLKRGEKHA